jgi:hypothetical protein
MRSASTARFRLGNVATAPTRSARLSPSDARNERTPFPRTDPQYFRDLAQEQRIRASRMKDPIATATMIRGAVARITAARSGRLPGRTALFLSGLAACAPEDGTERPRMMACSCGIPP